MSKVEEKVDKVLDIVQDLKVDSARNTTDLHHHIKRTDLLENKMTKITSLVLLCAGIVIAIYGPDFIKLLKVIL